MRYCVALVLVGLILVAADVFAGPLDTITMKRILPNFTDGTINVWDPDRSGECNGGIYHQEISQTQPPTGEGLLLPPDCQTGLLTTFCIELAQNAPDSFVTYQVDMPEDVLGLDRQQALRELWGRFFNTAKASPSAAEAFSAAVYEIVYEDNSTVWDVTTMGSAGGRGFRCENADTALANTWLAALDGKGPMEDLRVLTNPDFQDYLATTGGGGEIPEPTTLWLVATGGATALIAEVRRRRRR